MAKKVGIPCQLGFSTHGDLTGLASTITGAYKIEGDVGDGTTDPWTPFPNPFTETDQPGTYLTTHTFTQKGHYVVKFESTDPRIGTHFGKLVVTESDIDDVKAAIDAAQSDITAIRAQTDLLNTTELENLAEQIAAAQAAIDNLTLIVDSADAADSITSIRELLNEIQSGGVNVDNLLNGQANIQAMLRGDATLADGTTPNPLAGKGLDEIYDSIATTLSTLETDITNAANNVIANTNAARDAVLAAVSNVQTVVDSNAALLGDATNGLVAIKTAIDNLASQDASNYNNIVGYLTDATNGLGAISSGIASIQTQLQSMDSKLDDLVDRRAITVIA